MNAILLSGTVMTEPKYSHRNYKEEFYKVELGSMRASGVVDKLVCVVPKTIADTLRKDDRICITGEVRTRNYTSYDNKRHLDIFVYVQAVKEHLEDKDINEVIATGYICKKANVRKTPFGRKIIDITVASNREYRRSDYIPSIAWNGNAYKVDKMPAGTRVSVIGRLQSREYTKHFADGTEEIRTAYELSINHIMAVESEEEYGNYRNNYTT